MQHPQAENTQGPFLNCRLFKYLVLKRGNESDEERGGSVEATLESISIGCEFEPHQRHCVVSLSKTFYHLLRTGSTQENPSRHNWKIVDWDVKNQIKQIKYIRRDTGGFIPASAQHLLQV